MRLPFPERITPWHAGCFAVLLCVFEMLQGTPPLFAGCVFVYIMMATFAFNMAGGLYYPSGAYIFANSVFSLILAQVAKVLIGESADSNLRDPMTTIFVFTIGMAGMLFAMAVSRKLVLKKALLSRNSGDEDYRQIAIGCIATGIALPLIAGVLGGGEGSISSALGQFNEFVPLGLILAIYDEIKTSRGRRSLNSLVMLSSFYILGMGAILGTSKQGIFIPIAAYMMVCGALRFKFKPAGIATMIVVFGLMIYYLVPYAQVVRNYTRDLPTFGERVDAAIYWLGNPDEVQSQYQKSDEDIQLGNGPHYYNQNREFLERLSMVAVDDALINVADNGPKFGYQPIIFAVSNTVPRFIWRGKPSINYNNVYAHEVGLLSDEDFTTSVSFGPSADAFNMDGYLSVVIFVPLVMIFMFTILDSVSGSIKIAPWGLIYTVFLLHAGPEYGLGGCIGIAVQQTVVIVVSVYVARYALPLMGSIFFPERRRSILMRNVRQFPRATGIPPIQSVDDPV